MMQVIIVMPRLLAQAEADFNAFMCNRICRADNVSLEINHLRLHALGMFAELVDRHCRSLPGAAAERPFGPDTLVWTVGGRMFAIRTLDGSGVSVACRSARHAQDLVKNGKAVSAPYLKGPGWALFPYGSTSPDELRMRIQDSYDRVRDGLPAEVAFQLPARLNEPQQ